MISPRFAWGVFSILLSSLAMAPSAGERPSAIRVVTLTERVEAQRAVEAVLWRHRSWPAENARPKPALSQVLPDAELRARVEDSLAKSSALEDLWQRPITTAQLQAEMTRMVKGSQDPALLREMFEALGNDPLLIAETIARPALADRLVHRWYAYDPRFHAEVRKRAEEARVRAVSVADLVREGGDETDLTLDKSNRDEAIAQLSRVYGMAPSELPVGRLSGVEETEDGFRVISILSKTEDRVTAATVQWSKTPFAAWWSARTPSARRAVPEATGPFTLALPESPASCQPDSWSPIAGGAWSARKLPAFVWTGSELIVWGGVTDTWTNTRLTTGSRFDPATDTWTPTSLVGAPTARSGATAVWTGSEMIVWGGDPASSTGGRYDPSTDTWVPTSTTGAPAGRSGHTAVWTGTEMIVWGGLANGGATLSTGGRYDPVSDSWLPTSMGPNVPSAREGHTAVWTGSAMIVWGGGASFGVSSGARYDPTTDTWLATSTSGAPSPRRDHSAVWTGSVMIVWGGQTQQSSDTALSSGGRYDPVTNSWLPTAATTLERRRNHAAVWTGTEMIVWGGFYVSNPLNTGGLYDPLTNTWRSTAVGPQSRTGPVGVWTGSEMIVWGGQDYYGFSLVSGGRYSPVSNSWAPTAAGYEPIGRMEPGTVWTGTEMIVWGSMNPWFTSFDTGFTQGGRYTPATDTWKATTVDGAPVARGAHTTVWTGSEMIVWGGVDSLGQRLGNGGRYDPTLDRWNAMAAGGPSARADHSAVWTGTRMLVWGGDASSGKRNDGASYDPATDTWSSISSTGAPSPRSGHTSVWTGARMVVWGGGSVASGGRYDPSTDTWTPTASSPLAGRYGHTAVWTGNEMLVWGGRATGSNAFGNGARYNPTANTWAMLSGANAPTARSLHTAVWTGAQMIVWGDGTTANDAGGAYAPSTDSWLRLTTAGAPLKRDSPAAVWTGSQMIVWGGLAGSDVRVDGGSYCPCPLVVSYPDQDGDGFGDAAQGTGACEVPPGRITVGGDCNDFDPAVHPGAQETCNAIDDDCNGTPDDGNASSSCPDYDLNPCTVAWCDPSAGCSLALSGQCERDPRGLGYWTRLCSGTPDLSEALSVNDLDCLFGFCTFSDITTVEGLCARLHPVASSDPCARADAQLLAVVLDACRGRLAGWHPIQSSCTSSATVSDAMFEADALLCQGRSPAACAAAGCESAEIASGRAIGTDTLRLGKIPGGIRLAWSEPYSPDVGPPAAYRVWRRADPTQAFAMVAETPSPEWVDGASLPRAEYEVRYVWVITGGP